MADTIEGDSTVLYLGFLTPTLIVLITGLVIHSFFIGVNVTDWWKGKSVTAVDHIVTSLGISRMCSQCVVTLYFILIIPYSHFSLVFKDGIFVFLSYVNFWLSTLLSIVLCLKISNLHTRLFLYLRRMILHRIGHFIVVSLLLSALSCSIHLSMAIILETKTGTHNDTVDCTVFRPMYYAAIGDIIPLIFCRISSTLFLTSLYHHTVRMKMSSNLSINLETYYSVMRFVSITFIYNTMYCLVDFVCFLFYYVFCIDLPWICIVLEFLSLLHSSHLIFRTAKLRDQMSKVLHNVINFLFQRKDTETRNNIEIAAQ